MEKEMATTTKQQPPQDEQLDKLTTSQGQERGPSLDASLKATSVPIETTTTKIVQVETTTTQSKSRQLCPVVPPKKDTIQLVSASRSTPNQPDSQTDDGKLESKQRILQQQELNKQSTTSQSVKEEEEEIVNNTRHQKSLQEDGANSASSSTTTTTTTTTKQMFSLKQLARQSRQFASNHSKKRASLQATNSTSTRNADKLISAESQLNSLSLSDFQAKTINSANRRRASEAEAEPELNIDCSKLMAATGLKEKNNSSCSGGESKKTSGSSRSSSNESYPAGTRNFSEEDSNSNSYSSFQDSDQEEKGQSQECSSSSLASLASIDQQQHGKNRSSCDDKMNLCLRQERKRRPLRRATTSADKQQRDHKGDSCEHRDCSGVGPISWQKEGGGETSQYPPIRQVTDVDLITYKHLCHLETNSCSQCCQKLTQALGTANSGSNNCQCCNLSSQPKSNNYTASKSLTSTGNQQTNDCPYYELCLTGEEQLIRQKFAWFPPSLKSLQLVEQFFSYFAEDKIPYKKSESRTESNLEVDKDNATSYRERQVAYQLPRQDISLAYCSYDKLNDQNRAAYEQFVDKRNSQALDVATVVELQLMPQQSLTSQRTNTTNPKQQQQYQAITRKCSLSSPNQMSTSGAPIGYIQSNQRCRRCLVRLESGQLAVVAPNFVIGTSIYTPIHKMHPSTITTQRPELPTCSTARRASSVSMTASTGFMSTKSDSPSSARTQLMGSQLSEPSWPAPNCAMFHPQCFTCSTCKEFLVDLVYCLRDNKLYCLRHYGESLRPRCSWCQEHLAFSSNLVNESHRRLEICKQSSGGEDLISI